MLSLLRHQPAGEAVALGLPAGRRERPVDTLELVVSSGVGFEQVTVALCGEGGTVAGSAGWLLGGGSRGRRQEVILSWQPHI